MMEGLGADSEEKHEPAGNIDTAVMNSLKVLDPNRPIREATELRTSRIGSFVPIVDTLKPLDHLVVAVWLTIQGARREGLRHLEEV
jgi:hypothetical protein